MRWYRMAAEQGDRNAQYCLGCLFHEGQTCFDDLGDDGDDSDFVEAATWFRLAADQGLVIAEAQLGFCYKDGEGVVRNLLEAAIGSDWQLLRETSVHKNNLKRVDSEKFLTSCA